MILSETEDAEKLQIWNRRRFQAFLWEKTLTDETIKTSQISF